MMVNVNGCGVENIRDPEFSSVQNDLKMQVVVCRVRYGAHNTLLKHGRVYTCRSCANKKIESPSLPLLARLPIQSPPVTQRTFLVRV